MSRKPFDEEASKKRIGDLQYRYAEWSKNAILIFFTFSFLWTYTLFLEENNKRSRLVNKYSLYGMFLMPILFSVFLCLSILHKKAKNTIRQETLINIDNKIVSVLPWRKKESSPYENYVLMAAMIKYLLAYGCLIAEKYLGAKVLLDAKFSPLNEPLTMGSLAAYILIASAFLTAGFSNCLAPTYGKFIEKSIKSCIFRYSPHNDQGPPSANNALSNV